jgi:hypothetical protein
MADIFAGTAPANVNTTSTATSGLAPGFATYQDYLNNLASAGNAALATPTSNLVAPLTNLQNSVYGTPEGQANTSSLLNAGLSPLTAGAQTAATAASGVGSNQINNFLNPYISDVNKNLETSTQQNINQSVLPSLQALGASTGQTGSSRLLNATGQTLGAIQQGLGAQESQNLSTGYQNAVQDALQNQQNLTSAASTQGNIGQALESSTISGLNTAATLGAQGQAQNQAIINAPLTQASNASALLKGYTVPTTSTTNYTGPANVYGPSQLSQLLAAGTLANSLPAGTLSQLSDKLSSYFTSNSNGIPTVKDTTGLTLVPNATTAGTGQLQGADGKVYVDPSYGTNSSNTPIVSSDQSFNDSLPAGYFNIGNMQAYNPQTGDTIDQSQGP